ncbi:MAG: ATP phosphoribosyltransferase regulatory subunit, partial [Methylomonas sp.]
DKPTRLCYAGTILHTLGDALEKTRSPMQIGAELYGHAGIESDYEIICLMLETLALSGLENIHLDLGHVGIYRALADAAGLSSPQESLLFDILQRKAVSELHAFAEELSIGEAYKTLFTALPKLNGAAEVLQKAGLLFEQHFNNPVIDLALADLRIIAEKLARDFPALPVSFDLAELRGYHYHTGLVFAAFIPSLGREIARGGRYDNIGRVFGRARAATGFSTDLKVLVGYYRQSSAAEQTQTVLAPGLDDPDLAETIRDLRADGVRVIRFLPNQAGGAMDLACTATLEKQNNHWIVKPLEKG